MDRNYGAGSICSEVSEELSKAAMVSVTDILKPSEAVVFARVTLRDANRVIDEHILPKSFVSTDDAREIVVSDPDVLGGAPVMRGMRVPVYDVAASVAAALPIDRILAAYPSLDGDKIELAAIYAEANPARGHPRASEGLSKGAVIVADRAVPHRRKAV